MPSFLDESGVRALWTKIKNMFALKSHTHTMSNISDLKNQVPKNATRVSSGYDLNNYNSTTHCGWYYAGGSNNCLSKPSGVDAFGLQIVRNADGYIMQILYASNNNKNDIYTRVYGGGNWSGWEKLAQSGDLTWSNISGKPSTFTPSSHTHTSANITDLASKLEEAKSEVKDDLLGGAGTAFDTLQELANALGQDPNFATTVSNELGKKANKSHTHSISQVSDLQTELDKKVNNYAIVGSVIGQINNNGNQIKIDVSGDDDTDSFVSIEKTKVVIQGYNDLNKLEVSTGAVKFNDKKLATEEYVDNKVGSGGSSDEYIETVSLSGNEEYELDFSGYQTVDILVTVPSTLDEDPTEFVINKDEYGEQRIDLQSTKGLIGKIFQKNNSYYWCFIGEKGSASGTISRSIIYLSLDSSSSSLLEIIAVMKTGY